MNSEQFGGFVRTVIAAVGGYFAIKGVGDQALWTGIAGGAGVAAAAWWSFYVKKPAA